MMPRLASLLGLVVLAASSTACTYKTQTQVREVPVDYSDYAFYDRSYAPSPTYAGATGQAVAHSDAVPEPMVEGGSGAHTRGHAAGNAALGFTGGDSQHVTTEASSVEYEQVEATPGTACYEAAVKAGIQSGVCTLVSERKYVLVGDKAR